MLFRSNGACSAAFFTGQPLSAPRPIDPSEAPFPEEREAARDELHRWYADTTAAVGATRDQMGRAAGRFAAFAGAGIRELKAATARAGSLSALLFGTGGRFASLLAGMLVEAAAADPGPGITAALARRLDDQQRAAAAAVGERYERLRLQVNGASTTSALLQARESIRRARPGRLPTENQLYRDLLLQLARDSGAHLDGSAFNLRHRGGWWASARPDRPFAIDGCDLADELNRLDRIDPRTRKPFDTERCR